MSRNAWITSILVLLIAVAAGLVWWQMSLRAPAPTPGTVATAPDADAGTVADDLPTIDAELYFPGVGAMALYAERRELPDAGGEAFVRALVDGLIAGPEGGSLVAPLPDGVTLGAVFVSGDTAILDLRTPDSSPPPSMGSAREMLAVYSLVDTIVLGIDGIERVALLWNGRQQPTFAGHVDTTRPLVADRALLATR
ncbi:MAG: GerMN domain-containing protein [Acidobacteriota bacterium]